MKKYIILSLLLITQRLYCVTGQTITIGGNIGGYMSSAPANITLYYYGLIRVHFFPPSGGSNTINCPMQLNGLFGQSILSGLNGLAKNSGSYWQFQISQAGENNSKVYPESSQPTVEIDFDTLKDKAVKFISQNYIDISQYFTDSVNSSDNAYITLYMMQPGITLYKTKALYPDSISSLSAAPGANARINYATLSADDPVSTGF